MLDSDRRQDHRVDLAVTAVLFHGNTAMGRYVVENLSAGGASLTGPRDVRPDQRVQVLLPLPRRPSVLLDGIVMRRGTAPGGLVTLALRFEHDNPITEDAIHEALLAAVIADHRQDEPATLVVEDCAEVLDEVATMVASLGRRVLTATTPLDAVQQLEDPDERIEAAIIDVSVAETDGLELMRFIQEEHPAVRRILLQGSVRPSAVELMRASSFVHAVVAQPVEEAGLRLALGDPGP